MSSELMRELRKLIRTHEKFLLDGHTSSEQVDEVLEVVRSLERLRSSLSALEADRARMRQRIAEIEGSVFYRSGEAIRRATTARLFGSPKTREAIHRIRARLTREAMPGDVRLPELQDLHWVGVRVADELRRRVRDLLAENGIDSHTYILVKSGGMGDNIQITPVAKALKLKSPDRPVVAVVERAGSVLRGHPYIDLVIEYGRKYLHAEVVKSLWGLVDDVIDIRYVCRVYGNSANAPLGNALRWYYDEWPTSSARLEELKMHVCDIMLHSLGLEDYASAEDVLVTESRATVPLPENFVVVSNSVDSSVGILKKWPVKEWRHLITWLIQHGLAPVQLGTSQDAIIDERVVDLRGRTSPRQAAYVLKRAVSYVGVEGGLFHMAKAVRCPAVVMFASTPMINFAYSDTFAVSRDMCRACWWTPQWDVGVCSRGEAECINAPSWEVVRDALTRAIAVPREEVAR